MFGRIEGDTVYNLMKMAEAEMVDEEGSERPLYPTKITGAEVLVNPFEDMIAKVREAPRVKDVEAKKEVKKRKKAAGKNVLSFGGEDEEDDVTTSEESEEDYGEDDNPVEQSGHFSDQSDDAPLGRQIGDVDRVQRQLQSQERRRHLKSAANTLETELK